MTAKRGADFAQFTLLVLTLAARAVGTTEPPSPNPLRKLLALISSQIADLDEQLKILNDELFVDTDHGAVGALVPTGEEEIRRQYGSGGGRGNLPPDSALSIVEWLAGVADVLAEMQERVAEEARLDTAQVRRSRGRRRADLATMALVGIAAWLVWRCARRRRVRTWSKRPLTA